MPSYKKEEWFIIKPNLAASSTLIDKAKQALKERFGATVVILQGTRLSKTGYTTIYEKNVSFHIGKIQRVLYIYVGIPLGKNCSFGKKLFNVQ